MRILKKYLTAIFLVFIAISKAHAVEELTLNSETAFSPTYQNHFSFLFGLNPSIQKANDITNFSFSYAKKMETKDEYYWFDTGINFTNGVFNKLTTNNAPATGLTNDQLVNTKSSLITIGMGVGRESHYAAALLPYKDLYELTVADLTYNIYKESISGKSFTGPGILAKFSLYKKFSDYMSAGTQFTYNLAVVKRTAINDTENSSVRSLTISYLTIGFDLSFYL